MEKHQGFTGCKLYDIWRNHAIKHGLIPPTWDAADAATRETWEALAAYIMPSD